MAHGISPIYLAHSENGGGQGVPELLCDHLQRVAELARSFAAPFSCADQAYVTGLLHDVGKYGERFQKYLRGRERRGGNHAAPGAIIAAYVYRGRGLFPALAIDAHHGQLDVLPGRVEDFVSARIKECHASPHKFSTTELGPLKALMETDGLRLPASVTGLAKSGKMVADMLDARMLFSALVDADYLATEGHFAGDRTTPYRPVSKFPPLDMDRAIQALEAHLDAVRHRDGNATSRLRDLRESLLADCLAAADSPTGLFTLSAPTGSGKTLTMLAFALHHARRHHLRRIVVVLPYLNIIDQTAQEYRTIFSEERGFPRGTVLEHHSLAELGRDDPQRESQPDGDPVAGEEPRSLCRELAPNWDAPIIITTTVQFFESLFAAHPSRCRKLHRLAKSVILFDEVQTLPTKLAVATLAALSRLAQPDGPYGSSIVFATATQPAFSTLSRRVAAHSEHGWQPREIVRQPRDLFAKAADRVETVWRHEMPLTLADLAEELKQHDQVLCIVNVRRHAAELARLLSEGGDSHVLHLSTNLCPAHRLQVLAEVKRRLDHKVPIRLIATQCVEAGVDFDFPLVYRARAPLEALVQAAGRCNRNGKLASGQVVVFRVADERPDYPPEYKYPVDVTLTLLKQLQIAPNARESRILSNPDTMGMYFTALYKILGRDELDSQLSDEDELWGAINAGRFDDVQRHYRLIPQVTISLLTPYNPAERDNLLRELESPPRDKPGWIRDWIRRASRYAVSTFRPKPTSSLWNHLEPITFHPGKQGDLEEGTWFLVLPGWEYDKLLGLTTPPDANDWLA